MHANKDDNNKIKMTNIDCGGIMGHFKKGLEYASLSCQSGFFSPFGPSHSVTSHERVVSELRLKVFFKMYKRTKKYMYILFC